jgi:hypothetical protein
LPPPEALADRVPLPEEKKRAQRRCICVVIRRNTTVSKLVENTHSAGLLSVLLDFYHSLFQNILNRNDSYVLYYSIFPFKFFIFPRTVIFVWKIMQD